MITARWGECLLSRRFSMIFVCSVSFRFCYDINIYIKGSVFFTYWVYIFILCRILQAIIMISTWLNIMMPILRSIPTALERMCSLASVQALSKSFKRFFIIYIYTHRYVHVHCNLRRWFRGTPKRDWIEIQLI